MTEVLLKHHQLGSPGPELDVLYEEILRPSFTADELSTLPELRQAVDSGLTSVWVSVDERDRILGAAIGEWEPQPRVVLLAWMAVRPGLRGAGIGGPLLRTAVDAWKAAHDPCLILTEVADPHRHDPGDEAHGDPVARLRFYQRQGARILDLPYFQAALGPGRARVPGMLLLCLHGHPDLAGSEPDTIDGATLRTYLECYQIACEGAIARDEEAMRLWRAVDRPGGVPFTPAAPASVAPRPK